MFDVSSEMFKATAEIDSIYLAFSDLNEHRFEKCLESECMRRGTREKRLDKCWHIFPIYFSHIPHGVASGLFYFLGEIFELKAELNSDKKEKKKEAVKKVIASMTVGKDVRWA